jgi:hypothetical protein
MLEGMWQLKWASLSLKDRPARWRGFSVVYDWRLLIAMDESGEAVSTLDRREVLAALERSGTEYLTESSKKLRARGRQLPVDPYVKTWHNMTVRQLATETDEATLYETKYSELSDRMHWGLHSFNHALDSSDGSLRYDARSVYLTVLATTLSFRCVADAALIVSRVLNLGQQEEIETLVHRFVSDGIEYGMLPHPSADQLHAP